MSSDEHTKQAVDEISETIESLRSLSDQLGLRKVALFNKDKLMRRLALFSSGLLACTTVISIIIASLSFGADEDIAVSDIAYQGDGLFSLDLYSFVFASLSAFLTLLLLYTNLLRLGSQFQTSISKLIGLEQESLYYFNTLSHEFLAQKQENFVRVEEFTSFASKVSKIRQDLYERSERVAAEIGFDIGLT